MKPKLFIPQPYRQDDGGVHLRAADGNGVAHPGSGRARPVRADEDPAERRAHPHTGTAARETREEMALRTAENVERFLDGLRPLDVLNPEVYGEAARHDERIG